MNGSLGEQEMLLEHKPRVSVSTAYLSSPKIHERFYNSIEVWRTCFLFLLENTTSCLL